MESRIVAVILILLMMSQILAASGMRRRRQGHPLQKGHPPPRMWVQGAGRRPPQGQKWVQGPGRGPPPGHNMVGGSGRGRQGGPGNRPPKPKLDVNSQKNLEELDKFVAKSGGDINELEQTLENIIENVAEVMVDRIVENIEIDEKLAAELEKQGVDSASFEGGQKYFA